MIKKFLLTLYLAVVIALPASAQFTFPTNHFSSADDGTLYASWATTGSAFPTGNNTRIAPLNGLDIVEWDPVADTIATLRWGGSSFSQVGNALSVTAASNGGVVNLSTTRAAIISTNGNTIQAYDFDGTDWTVKGNALSITIGPYARGCRLADNDIVVWDATVGIGRYSFDGTDFTLTGNVFASMGIQNTLACLGSTRIANLDSAADTIRILDHDGTNWTQTGNTFSIDPAIVGSYGMSGLSENQFTYFNSDTQMQTATFNGTDITKEGSASSLTGLSSWPRSMVKMTDTLIGYHSFGDADIRAAVATLQ